nr:uncharacterized protein LOC115490991 [Taeniopygia guttata]
MVPVPAPSPAAGPPGSGAVGSGAQPSASASQSIAACPASVSPVSPPSLVDRGLSHTPLSQEAGTRIAQLVPFQSCVPRADQQMRGDGGFESTGPTQVLWSSLISANRPQMVCSVVLPGASPSRIHLQGLIDTGADVTVVSASVWPPKWPLDSVGVAIEGLGVAVQTFMCRQAVLSKNMEGQTAKVRPYVTAAPVTLWGRDVPAAWGVRIGTDF